MRRVLGSLVVALVFGGLSVVLPASPAAAEAPSSFVFTGGGFGHGVGMSQYGAYGQALEGRSATEILQHYYTGATVTPANDLIDLRVNLLHTAPSGSVQVRGESVGTGGGGIQISVDGGAPIAGAANDVFSFGIDATTSKVTVSKSGGPVLASGDTASIQWAAAPTVLNVAGSGDTFESSGHRYRYGTVDIAAVSSNLEVVNQLKLHGEYLKGISEVPSSWPAEALRSQAIAARTYALKKYNENKAGRAECRCHVYDTVADQVFAGYVKETSDQGAKWVAAVDSTSPAADTGLTIQYNGALIGAYYFSSSGGRTENNEDGFGGSPLPYLRSVDDHWSNASYNPKASWTFTKTQAEVAAAFGLPDVVSIDLSKRTDGGAVKSATARSSTGTAATISGNTLRSKLGLPGAWLHKPVVRLAGGDRFSTSVAIGQAAAPNATTVVIAGGDTGHLVDGLVAAPLAGVKNAPLLLSAADALPDSVGDDVEARHATTAYLVGGESALSKAVEDGLKQRGVATVTRISGGDRYETAAAAAKAMGGTRKQAVVASGDSAHLVDALAAGGPAAATGFPILLVARDTVPDPTKQAISDLGVTDTTVVGGDSAISDQTMASLPSPHRVFGPDRYATATAIADNFSGVVGKSTVVVASGANDHLVDALPGGALEHLTLLTAVRPLTANAKGWLQARPDVGGVQVVGGSSAVGDDTLDQIRAAIGG